MPRGDVTAVIVAVVAYLIVSKVFRSDVDPPFKKHYPGACRRVQGLQFGSEDLEVTKDGLAFITSGVWFPPLSSRYTEFLKTNNIKGSIFLYDFNKPDLGARKVKLIPSKHFNPETFHPHGISILEDTVKGEHLLYIINHPEQGDDAVEKFRYQPKTKELVHLKSFSSVTFEITNDLAVVGEDKFYISNFLYFKNYYLGLIERGYIPFNLGSLVFFNSTDFSVVATRLNSPNGLFLSKDKRYLYLALPRDAAVKVYQVKEDNSLLQVQLVDLHAHPDNLHLSQSGDALYTGAHPVLRRIGEHLRDPSTLAPASVLRLPLADGKIVAGDVTELFYDHGDLISGSSVAAVYNNKLLIGSVINKLVICDVDIKL